jgi:hypothetical protein
LEIVIVVMLLQFGSMNQINHTQKIGHSPLWAATSAQLDGKPGVYCEDCDIAAPTDPDSPMARFMGVNAHACSDESAERLWGLSEKLLQTA